MRTLIPVVALLPILLTACGGDGAATTRTVDVERSAPIRAADTKPVCPESEGGECLGQLDPGRYTTASFSPALTYTVPAGWTNGEDLPGNVLLQLNDDSRYIGIYRDANVPYQCEEHPDPDVSQKVSDYTRWLRRHPLLHVTKPRPVAVGGLHGVVMDISKGPGAKGKGCAYDGVKGVVPFIVGGRGPASLHHVITDEPGWTERLYLLRYRGGNVAIEIGPEGESLPAYLKDAAPVVGSLQFAKP